MYQEVTMTEVYEILRQCENGHVTFEPTPQRHHNVTEARGRDEMYPQGSRRRQEIFDARTDGEGDRD